MKAQITLQELATKLNGNYWEKGDLKRIYLDAGYNTKKMSTKTFVWQNENGEFLVSCKIDCPSQAWQWIKSQEEEVVHSVEQKIEEVLATEYFYIVNDNGQVIDDCRDVKELAELYIGGGLYLSEASAKRFIRLEEIKATVKSISRSEHEELYSIRVEIEKVEKISKIEKEDSEINIKAKVELGNGQRVKHPRFGLGEIIERTDDKVKILFEDGTEKLLLEKFANLTYL